ncbi:hypothetical protein SASPL_119496 [Salvia splendens]|uniref:RING finger and CHY zinc finger domain-containing protein 1 n=1 Tax=Salvia splendens TaxID=180675 RepID=A0A8X8ZUA2_SALSN|nr:hypothetical protein SASPL_156437 [Salvia splendens]KAG6417342.1 hypothetical protein SASPL_119496 [Salvia splendens]
MCDFEEESAVALLDDLNEDGAIQLDFSSAKYGCKHYKRRCKIRAPCCDENDLEINPINRHDIPRHEVKKVICSICDTEQNVQQNCTNCGVCMGNYFCDKCKFFDDDVAKKQYHCDDCGICRTGGAENFVHCTKCGCCYASSIKDTHRCVERAMHHNCAVCFEYLFDSTKNITVLPCGHTIHFECVREMKLHHRYSCPVCSKSIGDMSNAWRKLDEEIASTPMPEMYKDKKVR